MLFRSFIKQHFEQLALQPRQAMMKPLLLTPGYAEELEKSFAFTGFVDDRIIACAGIQPMWSGVGKIWAVLAQDIGGYGLLAVHKAVRRVLAMRPERRLEAEIDSSFEEGHRWIKMLGGFVFEGTMRGYAPDGRDCDRYARVV